MKKIWITTLLVLMTVLLSCGNRDSKSDKGMVEKELYTEEAPLSLSIGLMPAVDTAPIFLAQELGYYDELGLDLDISIFTNAQNRQSALQSGEIDGAMTDLVAVAVNVSGGFDIKATMLTDGMFPLLAVPGAEEKRSLKVGMMEISVSNFLVDQWLAPDYEIEKIYINSIPARLEAVASQQLDMGLFPEPIASVGAMKGLNKLIFEPVDGFSPDVMVFTGAAIQDNSEAIRRFHEGYNRAVARIRESEDSARDILIRSIPNLKPELRDLMTLPEYHEARLPDADYLDRIISWTDGILDQKLEIKHTDMVDRTFVTK